MTPLAWTPLSCDHSGVRLMPRNAIPVRVTNGTSLQVVATFAAALGLSVRGSDTLRPSESDYADAAWSLSAGRVVEHVAAETGAPSEWSYLVEDRDRASQWLEGKDRSMLEFLKGLQAPDDARIRSTDTVANTTEVVASATLPLDLGDLTMAQAIADTYGSNATDGSLQVRLFPMVRIATQGMDKHRADLEGAARQFLDCWLPQRSNDRPEWTVAPQSSFAVVRGDGLRLRVAYTIRTEKEPCFVIVDVDAATAAIWHVNPDLKVGDPLQCSP